MQTSKQESSNNYDLKKKPGTIVKCNYIFNVPFGPRFVFKTSSKPNAEWGVFGDTNFFELSTQRTDGESISLIDRFETKIVLIAYTRISSTNDDAKQTQKNRHAPTAALTFNAKAYFDVSAFWFTCCNADAILLFKSTKKTQQSQKSMITKQKYRLIIARTRWSCLAARKTTRKTTTKTRRVVRRHRRLVRRRALHRRNRQRKSLSRGKRRSRSRRLAKIWLWSFRY